MRFVFSYQIGFKRKRVLFGKRYHVLEVRDVVHHRLHFGKFGRIIEILPHSVFQNHGFTDVNYVSARVAHYIHAAVFGQIF